MLNGGSDFFVGVAEVVSHFIKNVVNHGLVVCARLRFKLFEHFNHKIEGTQQDGGYLVIYQVFDHKQTGSNKILLISGLLQFFQGHLNTPFSVGVRFGEYMPHDVLIED
jgi:hypothetical protein